MSASPAERAREAFERLFGGQPALRARAPGRIKLLGEHAHCSDSLSLSVAVDCDTVIAARARRDAVVHVVAAEDKNREDRFTLDAPVALLHDGHWGNCVRGVMASLQQGGHALRGMELVIASAVPQGQGLSASAALRAAVGLALQSLFNLDDEVFDRSQAVPRETQAFARGRHGVLDRLASVRARAGHAVLLDGRSRAATPVPLPAGSAIVVVKSGAPSDRVDELHRRRQQCEQAAAFFGVPALRDVSLARFEAERNRLDAVVQRRARHLISENARAVEAAQALRDGDLSRMGALMRDSHASMRDDFEVSRPPIDMLVNLLNRVIGSAGGARMTGSGFSGSAVALVPGEAVADVCLAVQRDYRTPQGEPPVVHCCSAAEGATVLA